MRTVKYVVLPFRFARGRFFLGETRKASSEPAAISIAEAMAGRFDGVAAFEVHVDDETGEMHDPRELVVFGRIPHVELAA